MKRLLVFLSLATALLAAEPAAFWAQLTPEERKAAGVDQLTPTQQAALDAAAARFAKEGARAEVAAVKAEATEAVRQVREQTKAETRAEVAAETKKKKAAEAGFAVREEDEVIRTRIVGEFRGWTGRSTFTLENGQVWQQTDRESRFFTVRKNPEVELIPNRLVGWKLRVSPEGLWIRVKRIN